MNIAQFLTQIGTTARSNLFQVSIPIPSKVATFVDTYYQSGARNAFYGAGLMQTLQRTLQTGILCSHVNLPGRLLDTVDVQQLAPAPSQKIPYGVTYTELNASFYMAGQDAVDARGLATLFTIWQSYILLNQGSGNATNHQAQWGLAYLKDYSTDIIINVIDRELPRDGTVTVLTSYKFTKAWPISIGDVTFGWGEQGQVQHLPVSFTYQNWHPHLQASAIL